MLLIDGKKVAAELRQRVKNDVDALVRQHGRAPHLAVILVGEDPASQIYVRYKEKACEEVGFVSRIWRLDGGITQCALEKLITELSSSEDIDGILLQLPLPKGLDAAMRAVFAAEGVDEPNAPGDLKRAVRDCIKAHVSAPRSGA